MTPWNAAPAPDLPPLTLGGRLRAARRGAILIPLVFGGLAVLLACRLVERPLCGAARPVTPRITVAVCRATLAVLGLRRTVSGAPMTGSGAMVANHASWLDIFVLNAGGPLYFVSKAEVASWPGIGWLARATGTVFIRRSPRDARAQRDLLRDRLAAGHRLLFFPEGTSTDGRRVIAFKTTLFSAFEDLDPRLRVQPVTVRYTAPDGMPEATYGWWGDMPFGPSLVRVLSLHRQGRVEVIYHPPLAVADHAGRKALARAAEAAVRAPFLRSAQARRE